MNIRIVKDGKYGLINSKNELIIPYIFDFAFDFENSVARVMLNGK